MSEFVKGIDQFRRKLKDIGNRAKELDGQHVSLDQLFTPEFMSAYTVHPTFEEMIAAGGFSVQSAEDFLAMPDDEWERHVAETTDFEDWAGMQSRAGTDWAAQQLRV